MDEDNPDSHMRARIVAEALPHMQQYDQQIVVVKYGGHAMGDSALSRAFAENIVMLKQAGVRPVVVHGGGPQIGAMLAQMQIESRFENGLRVTDSETIKIVEMVLSGTTNKEVVSLINAAGGKAVGISGKDANLVMAKKLESQIRDPETGASHSVDLGFVGAPAAVNPEILAELMAGGFIPVVAPVAADESGQTYNINADTIAGAVAGALNAKRLLFLTDVPGVLDKSGTLITAMSVEKSSELISDGTISGGMIPKVQTCTDALELGVEGAVILNGKVPHAVLLELFTEGGAGTLFLR